MHESTCHYFEKHVVSRERYQSGGISERGLVRLTALDSSMLSAVHRFPVYLWGGAEKKDLNPEQRHLCVIWEGKIPEHEIYQYEVNHLKVLVIFKGRAFVVNLFACFKIKTHC